MVCPFCLNKKSEVYNSRNTKKGTATWRRRRCLNCGKSFTTEETFDPSAIWKVKKNDGRTVGYSRSQLALSMLRACDHRTNQDASVWYLYQLVEQNLLPMAAQGAILTSDIVEQVGAVLKRFDPTAYVKYLSYHQPIVDAKTLRKQLHKK